MPIKSGKVQWCLKARRQIQAGAHMDGRLRNEQSDTRRALYAYAAIGHP